MGSAYRNLPIGQNPEHTSAPPTTNDKEASSTKVQQSDWNTETQSEHVAASTTKMTAPVPPPQCAYLQQLDLVHIGAQFEE